MLLGGGGGDGCGGRALAGVPDVLAKYGVDTRDYVRASERVRHLMEHDLRNSAAVAEDVRAAWESFACDWRRRFVQDFGAVTAALAEEGPDSSGTAAAVADACVTGEAHADLLSEWAALAERHTARAPDAFPIPDPERVVRHLVGCALPSPSLIIRLLAIHAVKVMSRDAAFLTEFFARQGHFAICLAMDSEVEAELDHALSLVAAIAEQALQLRKSAFEVLPMALSESDRLCSSPRTARGGGSFSSRFYPSLPYAVILRLVTLLDINDTRFATLTQHRRHQVLVLLRDVMLLWPLPTTAAGAVRTLMSVAVFGDLTREQCDLVLDLITTMYDSPSTRRYFRHADLSYLFAPFFELDAKDASAALAAMNQAKELVTRLVCTWPGLLWVASEGMNLRAAIDLLHLPGPLDNKMVLVTLFSSMLRRCAPLRGIPPHSPWQGASLATKKRTLTIPALDGFDAIDMDDMRNISFDCHLAAGGLDVAGALDDEVEDSNPTTNAVGYSALDPLLGALLIVLDHAGLPRALMMLLARAANEGSTGMLAQEAATLLQHVLVLMDTVLPASHAAGLHEALSREVARLSRTPDAIHVTMKLFSNLAGTAAQASDVDGTPHSSSRLAGVVGSSSGGGGGGGGGSAAGAAVVGPGASGHLALDDAQFHQMLRDSLVEAHNEHSKWNFDTLAILVQGPLRNAAKLRWVRDNTRLFPRILTFFKPSVNRTSFCSLAREDCQPQVAYIGAAFIEVLLASRDGVEVLEKAELLRAFKAAFQEVVDNRPTIFTRERIASTMTPELFRLFGRFSASAHGLMLLLRHNMFGLLQQVFEDASKPQAPALVVDVCHRTLQHLHLETVPNFGVSHEARLILKMALTSQATLVRLCGVTQLRRVLWRDLSSSLQWGIHRMVEALSATTLVVIEHTLKLLTSICASSVDALDYFISQEPVALLTNPILSEHKRKLNTASLLYRVLGRPAGFAFLHQHGWVAKELAQWCARDALTFVDDLDRLTSSATQLEDASSSAAAAAGGSGGARRSRSHTRTYSDSLLASRGSPAGPFAGRPRGVSVATAVQSSDTLFPPHLVGELCRTEDGCALYVASDAFHEAVNLIMATTDPIDALQPEATEGYLSLSVFDSGYQQPLATFPNTGLGGEGADEQPGAAGNGAMPGSLDDLDATYSQHRRNGRRGGNSGGGGNGGRDPAMALFLLSDNSFDLPIPTTAMAEDIAEELAELLEMEEVHQAARQLQRDAGRADASRGSMGAAAADSPPSASLAGGSTEKRNAKLLLSACRGYGASVTDKVVACHGDTKRLRAAMLAVAHVCCSDVGMAHMERHEAAVLTRLMDLARFASHPTVRGTAIVATSIAARCSRGEAFLGRHGFTTLRSAEGYVSSIGVPFSVSFAHPRGGDSWTHLPPVPHLGHTPSQARRMLSGISAAAAAALMRTDGRRGSGATSSTTTTATAATSLFPGRYIPPPPVIVESVKGLANPVSREACKQKLYMAFKQDAGTFFAPAVRQLLQEVTSAHRMRHQDRKFVADLLAHARAAEVQRRRQLLAAARSEQGASTPPPQRPPIASAAVHNAAVVAT